LTPLSNFATLNAKPRAGCWLIAAKKLNPAPLRAQPHRAFRPGLATKDGQCRQTNDERNFAGRRGNDEDAPKPDLTAVASGLPHPTLLGHSASYSERLFLRRVSDAGPFAMFGGTVGPASESLQRRNPRDGREGFTAYGDLRAGRVAPVMRRSAEQGMAEPRQRWE
jgi:hypothetical protein